MYITAFMEAGFFVKSGQGCLWAGCINPHQWAAFAAARYGPAGITPAAMLRIPGRRSSAGRPVDFVWGEGAPADIFGDNYRIYGSSSSVRLCESPPRTWLTQPTGNRSQVLPIHRLWRHRMS